MSENCKQKNKRGNINKFIFIFRFLTLFMTVSVVQKSWGPWTTYGGGGFWYHHGKDNKNYWFAGWLLQREISKMLTLGTEVFNTSPTEKGESGETGFNVGGSLNLSEEHHILFSAGSDFRGPNTFFGYFAFQWTFGPAAKRDSSWKADGKAYAAQSR